MIDINLNIPIDTTPTDGSTNLIDSNAVFDGLALKVDKVTGKQLSTEDYTTAEKSKLAGIAENAEVNVNSDWDATSGDAQILNKPNLLVGVHNRIVIAGQVYNNALTAGTTVTTPGATNRMEISPLIPINDMTVTDIGINVTTVVAGSLARIIVYSDLNGTPNLKLIESTNLDCSTLGFKKYLIDYTFQKGVVYWLGIHFSAAISVRAIPLSSMMPLGMTGNTNPINTCWRSTPVFGSAPAIYSGGTLVAVITPEIRLQT